MRLLSVFLGTLLLGHAASGDEGPEAVSVAAPIVSSILVEVRDVAGLETEWLATARSLCSSIAEHDFSTSDFNLRLTVSIGIALYPGHARDATGLIRAADGALYRAKESGRNRVCFC